MMESYLLYKITSKNTDAAIIFRSQFESKYTKKWLVNLAALPLDFDNEIISYVRKYKQFKLQHLLLYGVRENGFDEHAVNTRRQELKYFSIKNNIKETFHVNFDDVIPYEPSTTWWWKNFRNKNKDYLLPNEISYKENNTEILEKENDSDRVMLRCFLKDYLKIVNLDERKTYLHGLV